MFIIFMKIINNKIEYIIYTPSVGVIPEAFKD